MSTPSSTVNDEEHNNEYAFFHQMLKFQENIDDTIHLAHVKRVNLLLNHLESKRYNDRTLTHLLLQQDLQEYGHIIDNKDGLNNYAEYINNLCSKSLKPATACDKWVSNLENCDTIKSVIRELSLDKKTLEETEADAIILQNCHSKIQNHLNTNEIVKKSLIEPIKECQSEKPNSAFLQVKKPFLSTTSSFNPAKNFSAIVTHQKRPDSWNQAPMNKRSVNEIDNVPDKQPESFNGFRTAKTELNIQNIKKYGNQNASIYQSRDSGVKRSLGARSRSVKSKFVPPIKSEGTEKQWNSSQENDEVQIEDESLKGLDPKMIELIRNEIMDHGNPTTWDDISGLEFAKKTIQEIVVWPLLRPDIFTGLRRPPKGILLFGPPGTGKTLIGKCIASQSSSTFFSISASSLTSKWIGESEKLVRTLFAVARCHQPAVIFIDEIDSLLSQRNESEHESSRRIKTEFLVQLDGATTHEDDRILVIGATNRPQELDEAARRRLVKRLYIPLPEFNARKQIVQRLMSSEKNELSDENMDEISTLTDGYSGADMKNLCQEASLGPIRSIDFRLISSIESQEVRAVTVNDFKAALKVVRSSVSPSDLNQYLEWDKIYGSRGT